ncbi:MAG TPA: Ig-like domain-containing protein [Myxococcales bacterium]|nr:Ig-like domain-containing protein [Myxococcales bacterium]
MRKFSAVLASSVLFFACGRSGDGGTPAGKTVTSISLSPATVTLAIGGTQGLQVSAVFSDNSTAIITTSTFASSAPAVATVSDSGLVTAVAAGSATITATQGTLTATSKLTVNAAGPATSIVAFADDYGPGITFAPFGGAVGTPAVDTTQHEVGTASLKVTDPATGFAGGAFKLTPAVDASSFNAITFWAMASVNHNIDKFGFGNDTSDSTFEVDWPAVPLTTTWTKFTLPLVAGTKLTALSGAFFFATAGGASYNFWLDQIQYETITLPTPTAAMTSSTLSKGVGDKVTISTPGSPGALTVTYGSGTSAIALAVSAPYFTFTSSNTAVATVDQSGVITCVGNGTATITGAVGAVAATGSITVNVAAGNAPTTAAPTPPTHATADVISLVSDVYTNHAVNTFAAFSANNNETVVTDIQIAGTHVKEYAPLTFVGIDFAGANLIDATNMTFVHVDYWTPDATTFGIKLVDFGANGTFDGPPTDPAAELDFTPVKGQWSSLELPLSQFVAGGLTTRAHLAQIIFIGSNSTLYIDNLYFHTGTADAGGTGSTPPATSFTVFGDSFPTGVTAFTPFQGNVHNDINVDTVAADVHSGTSALKVIIPTPAQGDFTGGAIVLPSAVNLSGTNALTFWAKATSPKVIDKFGLANDANGHQTFQVELAGAALTTTYQQFVIPLPDASQLTATTGVFHFATGSDANGVIFFVDDIQYGVLPSNQLGQGQPAIATETLSKNAGDTFTVDGTSESWFLNGSGTATSFSISPSYFAFTSSDPTVASVDATGTVTALKAGSTNITATFKGAPAAGEITLNIGAQAVPTVAPPRPTAAQSTVISLLSDAYQNVPVDHFKASFDSSTEAAVTVGADHVIKYSTLGFAAIETASPGPEIDATNMSFIHVDVWTPNVATFKLKLVDFGANGIFQGAPNDDTEAELSFNLTAGQWNSLDIPLTSFLSNGLAAKQHLAQYILSTTNAANDGVVYIDNLYFHQ